MRGRGRTLIIGALGGLLGMVLGVVLFPLLLGNRTAAVVLACFIFLCGVVLGVLALSRAGRR